MRRYFRCQICGKLYPELQRRSTCSPECWKRWRKLYRAAYYQTPRGKKLRKEWKVRYRETHPAKIKEYQLVSAHRYYYRHREAVLAKAKEKYWEKRKRKELIFDRKRGIYINNPDYEPLQT